MNSKSIPTGYVPVTLHLPEKLASEFQKNHYNWEALVGLFVSEISASEMNDRLLDLYFDFTRMMLIAPDEMKSTKTELCEHLYYWQRLCRAVQYMDNPDDHGAAANHPE